jgi:hypothetical protein
MYIRLSALINKKSLLDDELTLSNTIKSFCFFLIAIISPLRDIKYSSSCNAYTRLFANKPNSVTSEISYFSNNYSFLVYSYTINFYDFYSLIDINNINFSLRPLDCITSIIVGYIEPPRLISCLYVTFTSA